MKNGTQKTIRPPWQPNAAAESTPLRLAAAASNRHQPLRVVFFVRALCIGGAERQVVTLAKALDRKQFEAIIVCSYRGGAFEGDLAASDVRVISLDKKGRWDVISFLWRLARLLRQLKPDILHPYLTAQNLMAILMKPLLPSTRIVWGVRASNTDPGVHTFVGRLLVRLAALLSRFPNTIIFNSQAGRTHCESLGYSCASSTVIPNGVDLSYFSSDCDKREAARESWGFSSGSMLIGIVGRLDPMKDHVTFLRAAAIFAKSHRDAKFVCIGEGPEGYVRQLGAIAARVGIVGRFIPVGVTNDMPSAYNALDICCSSSAYGEGTPNCILEAMACGVPCVVTDVGDSRTVVGDSGIVVPPGNPEALAAGLDAMTIRLREDPALREMTRRSVEARYSIDTLVRRTSEVFARIA